MPQTSQTNVHISQASWSKEFTKKFIQYQFISILVQYYQITNFMKTCPKYV